MMIDMNTDNKKKKDNKDIVDTVIVNNNGEVIERYGSAVHEYSRAYTGFEWENKETGQSGFAKGHKQIAQSKINPKYKHQNIKQQSGFNAEIDVVAKTNADNIISKSSRRISRSNDVGRGNDMQIDIGDVNNNGNFIIDENGNVKNGIQLKFSGKYASEAEFEKSARINVNRMRPNGKWAKYENIAVPSEQYEPMKKYAIEQSLNLRNRAIQCRNEGNFAKAKELEQKAREYENCAKRIKNSGVSSQEAMEARKNPLLHTAKQIGKTAHQAGMEQVKAGAIIGTTVSTAQEIVNILKGEQDFSNAVKKIAKKSVSSATQSYVTSASGTILKGVMQSSKNGTIRALSKTNVPAMIVNGVTSASKSFKRYIQGEINELELANELGEKSVGIIASSWGATVGTAILPGIGTAIGGTIGYMASSILYQGAMKVYEDERLSLKQRKKIYEFVKASNCQMEVNRKILEQHIRTKYNNRKRVFQQSFQLIEKSTKTNDFDMFLKGMNQIVIEIEANLQFKNFKDIDSFMRDPMKKLEF